MPSKPGKPGETTPLKLSAITLPSRPSSGPLLIWGPTYLWPYRALKPVYPPGSCGRTSATPWFAEVHRAAPPAQWTATPMKSAKACGECELTSFASDEPGPNTFATSPRLSNAEFAVPMLPTLQPALVNGTHGAGAFMSAPVTMLKLPSGVLFVQYWKDDEKTALGEVAVNSS